MMIHFNLLLCDSAQVYDGKLSLLGAGWSWIRSGTPYAVAAIVDVPWDKTNSKLKGTFLLVNEDGRTVAPDGTNPMKVEVEFEVGRPVGLKPGSSQRVPLFIQVIPMDLSYAQPGRYSWRLEIDGEGESVNFDFVN